ncbi:ABC transporter substrate-binding protein [Microbacterium nanhaiense]|uniref:ABC transporter substrate-binding protein n=1 Tax=Microbacterium nanhaiense TaxID=1301026 RepID=A0ABQ2N0E6_9MICO|nr:ABC transporter substrate-binding protein [Microbacterium nanhaiense]GGO62531.1 ABC transporter substrate-binding protein [Microbacterium nanhaiense]
MPGAARILPAAALVGVLALAGCAGRPADTTLDIGLVLEPSNLDIRHTSGAALEQALVDNVYEGLVTRGENGDVVAALAKDWSVSDDGLEYTFVLQEGVTFHDGSPMTADDVVTSLTETKNDESSTGAKDLAAIEEVSAPDDGTVVITLAEPNINLLFLLTGPGGLIFKSGDDTDLKTAENGTGPFTLGEWIQKDSISLERYEDYWGEPAGPSEVVLHYIPDPNALVSAGLDGTLDVLTGVSAELTPQLEGDFTVTQGETTDKFILAFNGKEEPLDDLRVRQALRMAIDHEAILTAVGAGETQFGPIPKLDPGYEDLSDTTSFDPEGARALLAEAGVEDLTLTLSFPNVYDTKISSLLVSMFKDIGVTLEVDTIEFSAWLNDVYSNRDYQLSFVNHVEPRDFDSWSNPDYYYSLSDPDALAEVQGLYADAMRETDADASAQLLAEAARIVAEQAPADWLYTRADIIATAPGVEGFPTAATSTRLRLAGVTLAE